MRSRFLIYFLIFSSSVLSAQVKTIKVAKNKNVQDTAVVPPPAKKFFWNDFYLYCHLNYGIGAKYYKGSSDLGIMFPIARGFEIGIEASTVSRYLDVTGYDSQTGTPGTLKKNSPVYLYYYRMPLACRFYAGAGATVRFGIAPSYFGRVINPDGLLTRKDFYPFNLCYFGAAGRTFLVGGKRKRRFYAGVFFSGDIQPNLKTDEVRDPSSTLLYSQHSRNLLVGLELNAPFTNWYTW